MSYRVELPVFSGPMDLLLHLVRQQEVQIHDVSIARILEQYLEHLGVLQALDLADIGDFVVMASTLMEIKSRDLLPRDDIVMEDELDPRDDLIQRLLEYKRYRDVSRRFDRLSKRRQLMVSPSLPLPAEVRTAPEEEPALDLGDVEIWALTKAFARLLEETGNDTTLHIGVDRRDIRFYTTRVLERVTGQRERPFDDLFDTDEGRYGMIGAFQAILELMKQGFLRAHQDGVLGSIVVIYTGPETLSVDDVMSGEAEFVGADGEDEDTAPPQEN